MAQTASQAAVYAKGFNKEVKVSVKQSHFRP
jgi:hypothetical protein